MSDASYIADLADLFNRSVTIEAVASRDAAGKPVYAAPVTYSARIVIKGTAQRTLDGTVILGRGTVDVLTTAAITTQDRITLPAAFPPTQPPILSARLVDAELVPIYTSLVIG
jgi:hypothetical protein